MNKIQTFQQFLATQSVQVPVWSFIFNLIMTALLGFILSRVYVKYGRALSNRSSFANNFILLSTTTMLIISIVKSSLALSLGLVGALSIVRFRAAIKEPEELSYLFLCIAIGLGFGADQMLITIIAFILILAIILIKPLSGGSDENQNLHLTISCDNKKKVGLEKIVEVLNQTCLAVKLKRLDEAEEMMEASFVVEFKSFTQFEESKAKLQALNKSLRITFMDNKGII